ncbi:MAG TPA: hypothetical protein VFX98_15585 [Longimicrobiaceae bacterium]|nr:hypothetical protein [Longimicrobiaceae bacterium]
MLISTLIVLVVVAMLIRWVYHTPGSGRPQLAAHYEAEIARLREEVDLLNGEVRRLSEEQSFMVRLLDAGKTPAEAEAPDAPPLPDPDPDPETT